MSESEERKNDNDLIHSFGNVAVTKEIEGNPLADVAHDEGALKLVGNDGHFDENDANGSVIARETNLLYRSKIGDPVPIFMGPKGQLFYYSQSGVKNLVKAESGEQIMENYSNRMVSWMDLEIAEALKLYFSDQNKLSTVYWPRPLRNFLKVIIETLLKQNDNILERFQQNRDNLVELVGELSKPTSHSILVRLRKTANNLLRQISNRDRSTKFIIPRHDVESVPTDVWPSDIIGLVDLNESMSGWRMRSDVAGYLENFLEKTLPGEPYKITFEGYRSDVTELQIPIKIEVDSQCSDTLRTALVIASDGVSQDALTPVDVVQVVEVADIKKSFTLKEEGFHTSGSPWKTGTLGAIFISDEKKYYGITCNHVHRNIDFIDENQLFIEPVFRLQVAEMDVSLFQLTLNAFLFNLVPFSFNDSQIELKRGEEVFKVGRSTGLTVGTYMGVSTFSSGKGMGEYRYKDMICVRWIDDRFAYFGDCGALYCVRRSGLFIPIAIHRISSDDGHSYGSDFQLAMEYIKGDFNVDIRFVNAPFRDLEAL